MGRRYAEDTKVSVERSIQEIRFTVGKYAGAQFQYALSDEQTAIAFTKESRQVRFYVNMADRDGQQQKAALRALLLVIKAKLEAVESGIAIFEDEFLANIVLPDGRLVADEVRPALVNAYATGEMPRLLPNYSA